ncbi:MAG: hypothetical protein R3B48_09620 [Kofleriaceae bacterium]
MLPWTAMSGTPLGGNATRFNVGLYRDGALAIPALGITEGEYHVEVRGTDKLGRTTVQERCFALRILAPKLRPTMGAGARAEGFAQAMYSTSLNPGPGQSGDVSAKFLNSTAAGAAVWSWRAKNYLGVPIYVTVQIPQGVSANVTRQFRVRDAMTNIVSVEESCGPTECFLAQPGEGYLSPAVAAPHSGVRFRARLFRAGGGNELGAELAPCAGCTNDDESQTYTFEIPARSSAQGAPLQEYVVLTFLRPTLPSGAPLTELIAPRDPASPDAGGTYGEFSLNGLVLTGRLVGPPGPDECIAQRRDAESGTWICTRRARPQRYRALVSIAYQWVTNVDTKYTFSAAPALQTGDPALGRISENSAWSTEELPTLP